MALLVAVLAFSVVAVAVTLVRDGAMRRAVGAVPRAAWLCALVATLGAMAWSLILPPFQVPDEIAHYAYVEYVVQAGRLPPRAAGAVPAGPLARPAGGLPRRAGRGGGGQSEQQGRVVPARAAPA